MRYKTELSLDFNVSHKQLYSEVSNLSRHKIWNSGMKSISETGLMRAGMSYETVSIVIGKEVHSLNKVTEMIENECIEISNNTGAIAYVARYRFRPKSLGRSTLICELEFDLKSIVLQYGHSVIESMAKARLAGDLETLKALLEDDQNSDTSQVAVSG